MIKKELIMQLHTAFEKTIHHEKQIEFWYARDLQKLLGYDKWENFLKVIEKAKTACLHSKNRITDHFPDVGKMVFLGSGSQRKIDDIKLTRYACYLIAQNGDPTKTEIAFAQTYFAVQTRKQEIFANEITTFNTVRDNLKGETPITKEHVKNNSDIRNLLLKKNIHPEKLAPAEDVKKIGKKMKSEHKKLLRNRE